MTIEEAVKHFDNPYAVEHMTKQYEADEMALDALRSVATLQGKEGRENPKPLTIEELRKMDGEPVYVSDLARPDCSEYCVIHIGKNGDKYSSALVPGCECFWYDLDDYEDRWVAYRHKPKGE